MSNLMFPFSSEKKKKHMGVSWNSGTPSHHPFLHGFSWISHYQPSILGTPHLWNPPYTCHLTNNASTSFLQPQLIDVQGLQSLELHLRLRRRVVGFSWRKDVRNDEKMAEHHEHMGVSWNGGTPKSSILVGFSHINHPFLDTPIYGNPHIWIKKIWK